MEERSGFRPATVASASSLSLSGERSFPSLGILSGGGRSGSGDARFEGEYQSMRLAACASALSHTLHAMPPRITRNSHRPRASDRTMVDAAAPVSLAALSNSMASPSATEETYENGQQAKLLQGSKTTVGWISRNNLASGRGGVFFLTSPFIELIDRHL